MRIQKLGSELAVYLPRNVQRKLSLLRGDEFDCYVSEDNKVILLKKDRIVVSRDIIKEEKSTI